MYPLLRAARRTPAFAEARRRMKVEGDWTPRRVRMEPWGRAREEERAWAMASERRSAWL
jgi:hypothetical protein